MKLKSSLREKGHPKSNTYLKAKLWRLRGKSKKRISQSRKPQNTKKLAKKNTKLRLMVNTILMLKEAMPNKVSNRKKLLCINKDQRGVQEVELLTTRVKKMFPCTRGFSTQINQQLK